METTSAAFPSWQLLGSGVVGAVTFPTMLASSQLAVFKPLRLSYQPGLQSSLLGLASVTLASFGASLAALKTISVLQQHLPTPEKKLSLTYRHLFVSTGSGVVLFRALGGRFRSVLPSNLMRPGVFATEWIPALREAEHASPGEREIIQALGKKNGCHTCGTRTVEKFVADHQPPSRLLNNHRNPISEPDPLMQRFYPQCKKCSNVQGGILARQDVKDATTHAGAIRTHGSSLRLYHVFLPIPFLTAYLFGASSQRRAVGTAETSLASTGDGAKAQNSENSEATVAKKSSSISDKSDKEGTALRVWMDTPLSFPLFIVWQEITRFIDSFTDPLISFHLTLWTFTIIAALGSI